MNPAVGTQPLPENYLMPGGQPAQELVFECEHEVEYLVLSTSRACSYACICCHRERSSDEG